MSSNIPMGKGAGFLKFTVIIGIFLSFSGCREARMQVDSGLQNRATEMPVQGRAIRGLERLVTFGPFQLKEIDRSWTSTTTFGASLFWLDYSRLQARQRYQFVLNYRNAPAAAVRCATGVDQQFLDVILRSYRSTFNLQLTGRTNLVCGIQFREGGPEGSLALDQEASEAVFQGALLLDGGMIAVRGTRRLVGTSMPLLDASGYEFFRQTDPLAAVEIINDGAVWMVPGRSDREQTALGAASGALLLYQEIGR